MNMMFKANTAAFFLKCLSVQGSRQLVASSAIPNGSFALKNAALQNGCAHPTTFSWSMMLCRDFMTNDQSAANATSSSKATAEGLPSPPKRAPNVFALFVKNAFKHMPSDMALKDKFVRAAEEWRALSEAEKEEYKKEMTDGLVRYRQEMSSYLEKLSPEEMVEFKKMRKDKIKDRSRKRIKHKLRQLNYPKRPLSAYIFFIRDMMQKQYPDGKYPPVKSPEHIRLVGVWSQRWHAMNADERKQYNEQAEGDRKRYFEALEDWKHNLAKPENEEDLMALERMSRKIENANKNEEEVKKKQAKVAAKIIRSRVAKKSAAEQKAIKKKAVAKAKATKAATKPKSTSASKKKTSKKPTEEGHEDYKDE